MKTVRTKTGALHPASSRPFFRKNGGETSPSAAEQGVKPFFSPAGTTVQPAGKNEPKGQNDAGRPALKRSSVTMPMIQRAILRPELDNWFYDDVPFRPSQNSDPRNFQETRMLYEEFQLRYPGKPSNALYTAVINNLNANAVNNRLMVRQAVTQEEMALGLQNTAPVPPVPATNTVVFIEHLKMRQGSYNWAGGTNIDFRNWLAQVNPLANPLAIGATINCWEAILASAAHAGLISIADLRNAYNGPANQLEATLFNRLTQNGVTVINHPAIPPANNIQAGDIILIEGAHGPLSHVVAAIAPDVNDYNHVVVMSLWTASAQGEATAGGSLAKTALGELLLHGNTVRYSTL
ncbi:MAG: hypothetical protein KDD06_23080 [Phaeodactylibacter sp.]|nr:hypothetical protein [Phaeodactylibacter sp.]